MAHPSPPVPSAVTGRYRHPPAPWLWVALLVIPLIAALLGFFLRPASAPTEAGGPTAAPSASAQANWPVEVTGDANRVTVTATVADAGAKSALLNAVRQGAPKAQVEDRVSVVAGKTGTDANGLGTVVADAVARFQDFGVRLSDSAAVIRGTAPDQGTLDAVGGTAKGALPGRQVTTEFTRGAPVPTGDLTCTDLQGQIAARLAGHPVVFANASSTVTNASSERLAVIGRGLATCGANGIVVRGHTDTTGKSATNETLSAARAAAVRQVLVQAGVPGERVKSEGVGAREPVAFNDTEAGRSQNRRVEIRVGNEGQG